MPIEDLFNSRTAYWQHYKLDYFRRRVGQQVRSSKFNYYLQWKQAKKAEKRGKKSQAAAFDSDDESDSEAEEPMEIDF